MMGKKTRLKKERSEVSCQTFGSFLDIEECEGLVCRLIDAALMNDDADAMEGIASFASRLGMSLEDVRVSVTDPDNAGVQDEPHPIPMAAFLLEKPRIFSWLLDRFGADVSPIFETVAQEILSWIEHFAEFPVKQKMSTDFLRFNLRILRDAGELDRFLACPEVDWHRGEFGHEIMSSFLAEAEAEREKQELSADVRVIPPERAPKGRSATRRKTLRV